MSTFDTTEFTSVEEDASGFRAVVWTADGVPYTVGPTYRHPDDALAQVSSIRAALATWKGWQ